MSGPIERVCNRTCMHLQENEELCEQDEYCFAYERVVQCDNETDVIECPTCGKQKTQRCNFDENYS